ncbi:MAG TPA: hypothetical protein PKE21_13720 [Flavobacteriales bacterium]|nr:hypothetical protein [Flavobacteriales bacterium]HMR28535.1 hypothetical protein [Flavobacteriales bacterium]
MLSAGDRWVDTACLVRAGVSPSTLRNARHYGRGTYQWKEDPADRRRVLVRVDSLPDRLRSKVEHLLAAPPAALAGVVPTDADVATLRAHLLPGGVHLTEREVQRAARAAAYLRHGTTTEGRAMLGHLIQAADAEGLGLPTSPRKWRARATQVLATGVLALVNARVGNQNRRKIGPAQHDWLVAMAAQPNKPDFQAVCDRYNAHATTCGWPLLSESAVRKHLLRKDVLPVWTMGRHGTEVWRAQYEHTLKLRGPRWRDSVWCSDGTKLNYYYQDAGGQQALAKVYLVIDVYSEVILGYDLSDRENFLAQYRAFKSALKWAGHKPHQVLYDNQGGHLTGESQGFFDRASRLHFPAQPHNAKSKPIESLIGRLQSQVMRDRWFFTGQNIRSRSLDSRPNMEFILANRHLLPGRDQLQHYVEQDILAWNNAPHPTSGRSRLDTYLASTNPEARPVQFLDLVDLFWHWAAKPVTYTHQGLRLQVAGTAYHYEVYGADGLPDMQFLQRWTKARFRVKFDPEDMAHVRLYQETPDGDLRFVAGADTKRAYARAVTDLVEGERAEIDRLLAMRKQQREATAAELSRTRRQSGIDPRMLLEAGHLLGDKEAADLAEVTAEALPSIPPPPAAHYPDEEELGDIDIISQI